MKKILIALLLVPAAQLLAQDLKPTLTQALLTVIVQDDKGKPEPDKKITLTSKKTGQQFTGVTNAEGKFVLLIPPAQKYKVEYKLFSEVKDDELEMPTSERPYRFEYKMIVTPPRTFTLDNVFFDSGKATLRPESDKQLNELVELMGLQKTMTIEIAGHTDNVGTPESNQKLSEERANSVRQYLLNKKIEAARVTAKGYGDTMPVADNNSPAGKQKNRRTEVHILTQ
jgi:outer membrane protein OmpA-like peptidoglycan-associated protein